MGDRQQETQELGLIDGIKEFMDKIDSIKRLLNGEKEDSTPKAQEEDQKQVTLQEEKQTLPEESLISLSIKSALEDFKAINTYILGKLGITDQDDAAKDKLHEKTDSSKENEPPEDNVSQSSKELDTNNMAHVKSSGLEQGSVCIEFRDKAGLPSEDPKTHIEQTLKDVGISNVDEQVPDNINTAPENAPQMV